MSRWFGNRDPNWDGVRAASLANVPISISPGTVASVGLTAPAQYAVAGSPVTTSGTLALSRGRPGQHGIGVLIHPG